MTGVFAYDKSKSDCPEKQRGNAGAETIGRYDCGNAKGGIGR